MTARSRVSTHVLDAVTGRPAPGVPAVLAQRDGDDWHTIASGATDADGRLSELGPAALPAGGYRITFDTGSYFARTGQRTFYPEVQIVFEIDDPGAHYHVPLLLSPYAYSTYRGS